MIKKELRFCELLGRGGRGKPDTRLRLFPHHSIIQYRIQKGVLCLQSDMYQIRSSLNDANIDCLCCSKVRFILTVGVDA